MTAVLRISGRLVAATLAAWLAWLLSDFLAVQLPRLLLAAATRLQVRGFRHTTFSLGWSVSLPSEAPAWLHVAYEAVVPVGAAALVIAAALAARTAGPWSILFRIQLVFFSGLRLCLTLISWITSGQGAVMSALPFWKGAPHLDRLAGIAVTSGAAVMTWFCLHSLLRRFLAAAGQTARPRLGYFLQWLLLPVTMLGAALTSSALREPLSFWLMPILAGSLTLCSLPDLLRNRGAAGGLHPGSRGALVVTGCALLLASGLTAHNHFRSSRQRLDNMQRFVEARSPRFILHLERGLLAQRDTEEWVRQQQFELASVAGRLGLGLPEEALSIYLYESSGLKASVSGDSNPFTLRENPETAHQLVTAASETSRLKNLALLLMHHLWGAPADDRTARALAAFAAGRCYGQDLTEYARRIFEEQGFLSLRISLGMEGRMISPLVADVLSGAWIEQLTASRGTAILQELYKTRLERGCEDALARLLGTSWDMLEEEWRHGMLDGVPREPAASEAIAMAPAFYKGITLTQQGRRFGYGSEQAMLQLDRFLALGVDTVAIVPYGFTRAPDETTIEIPPDGSDDRVLSMVAAIHRHGFRCILKPQLITHQGYPGNIRFENPDRFPTWFSDYRAWLLHYARLAQLSRADALVVGTELAGITRFVDAWRDLIRDARRVYAGPLTYASNWGSDFDDVSFWDCLDFIGVNMYYPLSDGAETPSADSPRVRELSRTFALAAEKYGKKVVFTEVGYPNTATAAVRPWEKGNGRVNLQMQADCYATVFEAFYREPWFGGLLWWEWPTHGYGPRYYHTYNPIGKPALEVLRRWYGGPTVP